jgi:hypothetical protein
MNICYIHRLTYKVTEEYNVDEYICHYICRYIFPHKPTRNILGTPPPSHLGHVSIYSN